MKKGFTLIEILVVIAIIGLLASVIMSFLISGKNKSTDTRVKAQLNSLRSQAEVYYYNNGNSYGPPVAGWEPAGNTIGTGCNSGMFSSESFQPLVSNSNYPSYSHGNGLCLSTGFHYSVTARLNAVNTYWCVDSLSNSKLTSSFPLGGIFCQ